MNNDGGAPLYAPVFPWPKCCPTQESWELPTDSKSIEIQLWSSDLSSIKSWDVRSSSICFMFSQSYKCPPSKTFLPEEFCAKISELFVTLPSLTSSTSYTASEDKWAEFEPFRHHQHPPWCRQPEEVARKKFRFKITLKRMPGVMLFIRGIFKFKTVRSYMRGVYTIPGQLRRKINVDKEYLHFPWVDSVPVFGLALATPLSWGPRLPGRAHTVRQGPALWFHWVFLAMQCRHPTPWSRVRYKLYYCA